MSPPQISAAQQQQQKKGHPALTSQIFSQQQQQQPRATSPPASAGQTGKKGHPALTSTLFDHLKSAPQEDESQFRSNSRLPLSPSTSEESLGSKVSSPTSPHNNHVAGAKKGHPALTSTLFNHLKDAEFDQYGDRERNNNSNNNRDRAFSGGNDDKPQQVHAMTSAPAPAGKKGHPALTSTLFNHLKEPQQQQAAPRVSRQESQLQQQEVEQERPAGWRSDYVKPKGHPALTSTIFSQAPPPVPNPAVSRPYKKTSHNIFGPPPVEKVIPATVAPAGPVATKEYALEPSVLESELERNEEQQQEMKESVVSSSELTTEDLEKQVLELEKLKVQEEQYQAQQALEAAAAAEKSEPVIAEPTPAPTPAPVSAGRKIHPNYRSSFTIGGSR